MKPETVLAGTVVFVLIITAVFALIYCAWWVLLGIVWWAFNIATPLLWTYPIGAAVVSMILGSTFKRGK